MADLPALRCATTCHAAGLKQYGFRLLESRQNIPGELIWYTEGYEVDCPSRRIEDLQDLQDFKARNAGYKPPSYLYDVVRFSHKVAAAIDAFSGFDGIGAWVDADCVVHKTIPPGYIEDLLQGRYMAVFARAGAYTETGFWVMDCRHPDHQAFLNTWWSWYETGAFKDLDGFTDCHTLDATMRLFIKDKRIQVRNLTGDSKSMHPQAEHDLAQYLDHCKGPERKKWGRSPENRTR